VKKIALILSALSVPLAPAAISQIMSILIGSRKRLCVSCIAFKVRISLTTGA